MSAVLERHHCAQVPHRQLLPLQVQRALSVLDRAADGEPMSGLAIEQALRTTGDLDAPRLRLASRNPTFAEGQ